MPRIREEFDGDFEHSRFSETPNNGKRYEIVCSECGRSSFCDEGEHDLLVAALEEDIDNQFICDSCRVESEMLEH